MEHTPSASARVGRKICLVTVCPVTADDCAFATPILFFFLARASLLYKGKDHGTVCGRRHAQLAHARFGRHCAPRLGGCVRATVRHVQAEPTAVLLESVGSVRDSAKRHSQTHHTSTFRLYLERHWLGWCSCVARPKPLHIRVRGTWRPSWCADVRSQYADDDANLLYEKNVVGTSSLSWLQCFSAKRTNPHSLR